MHEYIIEYKKSVIVNTNIKKYMAFNIEGQVSRKIAI
jgi:hypothetical protein